MLLCVWCSYVYDAPMCMCMMLLDRMVGRHKDTQQAFAEKGVRMLYYVSMEFLMTCILLLI